MKILAIIPARGGSKRIPGKNVKKMLNKPLLAWAIEAARNSCADRVIVSTDDPGIAKIAKRYGAEVPFLRPHELSNDTIGIEPVLRHALEWLKQNGGYSPDAVALLMPTNPLRLPEHINEAAALMRKTKADSVVAVAQALGNNNPHWMLVQQKGSVRLFNGKPLTAIKTRSQELPPVYSRNDILYLLKPKNIYEKIPNLYGKKIELYVMDELFYSDINSPEDWAVTENKLRRLNQAKRKSA
jgi:CMP-N-acetylneuraminic acid synthetase